MKFGLIDRIVELERGERIVAVKAVSLAEEYLSDHFPSFPVLPGVLMLEAMCEAGAWLVYDSQDFGGNVALLHRARNVTYKSFVKPGNLLTLTVTCRRMGQGESEFDGVGHCNDKEVVRARFEMRHISPDQTDGSGKDVSRRLMEVMRARLAILRS